MSAFAQAKVSVCHVQAPPIHPDTAGLQGSAALFELVEGVFTIATNNHVLKDTETDFLIRIDVYYSCFRELRQSV